MPAREIPFSIQSPRGTYPAAGPTGPTGAAGATGSTGAAGPGTPAAWSSSTTYGIGSFVIGSDNKVYVGKTASNTNHDPTSATANWANLW